MRGTIGIVRQAPWGERDIGILETAQYRLATIEGAICRAGPIGGPVSPMHTSHVPHKSRSSSANHNQLHKFKFKFAHFWSNNFKGHLPLTWPDPMEKLLYRNGLRIKDFGPFVEKQGQRLKVHAKQLAEKHRVPYLTLQDKQGDDRDKDKSPTNSSMSTARLKGSPVCSPPSKPLSHSA